SKGALISLTKSMAIDYAKENIRVNAVCPGTTFTKGLEERFKKLPNPEESLREMSERRPLGRLGKEEEIAFAILFAACDEAAYMTGSIISIDGGATA
ncbi:MAG TPA: SDR family oxidoreductase, partial [Dictyoglomaceae bacterium]|nr:SDR family oxidoreductase [Dictyoglomaceae bacterium]